MNVIRTQAVELSSIPAIAYKQKLASGGAGIKIMRRDTKAKAVFTLNRRTGEAVPYGNPADPVLFPEVAVTEALELTCGLPYSGRGITKAGALPALEQEAMSHDEETDAAPDKERMIESDEYKALVKRYHNSKGRLNYQLMNKEFIQFASKSTTVSGMIEAGVPEEDIVVFIVKSRTTFLSGKKESMSDEDIRALIETLEEIDPRGAFKDLKAFLRRKSAKK